MKKVVIIVVTILILLVAGGIYLNSPRYSYDYGSSGDENSAENFNGTYNVDVVGFSFSPSEIKIKVGETITWTNYDSAQHTITSDSGNELNSEYLSKGETYSHTFTEKGVYEYHCIPHPYMKGRIIVE
ncbi:MAG: cupredoxin family copper-binding protein [Nanoarchaeota archaeon]|nr:cupredoxin family copper-binding protein [Nanoarchaeota archaeon]